MTDDTDTRAWRIVSDRERVRDLADAHDAVPTVADRQGDRADLGLDTTAGDAGGERVSWDEFFERLEATGRVVRYRSPDDGGNSGASFEIVDRDAVSDVDRTAESAIGASDHDRDRDHVGDSHQITTSDTGGSEPVAFDETGSGGAESDPDDPSNAPTADAESGPTAAADGLVLDEISEGRAGLGHDLADEHLVFENDGEQPIGLGGWTVENDDGRSYTFPDVALRPGERVTLHSGEGEDTEDDLYWNAEEAVWDRRDTVTVTDGQGSQVLREPYEA